MGIGADDSEGTTNKKSLNVRNMNAVRVNYARIQVHMWQSWVQIGHYSVAYFDRITVFKVLKCRTFIKGGAHTHSEGA